MLKKFRWFISLCLMVCLIIAVVPAVAAEMRASEQIGYSSINVTAFNGSIKTDFSITGTSVMDKIGCGSIFIYEKSGSRWILCADFSENDTGMSRTNFARHANVITWACESGVEYRVDVTVFAENSAGRDTRSKTVYVTG